jgi:hypothetical protein
MLKERVPIMIASWIYAIICIATIRTVVTIDAADTFRRPSPVALSSNALLFDNVVDENQRFVMSSTLFIPVCSHARVPEAQIQISHHRRGHHLRWR